MRIARVFCFFTPPPSKKRKTKKGDGSFFPFSEKGDGSFFPFSEKGVGSFFPFSEKGDGSFFPIFSGKDLVFLTFSSIFVPTIRNCKKSHNYAPKTKNP